MGIPHMESMVPGMIHGEIIDIQKRIFGGQTAGFHLFPLGCPLVSIGYPLVICYIPIEIDGLPSNSMVDLSMANC